MKNIFATKPAITPIDAYKILYNVGGLMDLPTGFYVKGTRGENILNGGMGSLVGIVGKPNTFKSTIAHYVTLSAASKVAAGGYSPYINTFDTEMNIHPDRLRYFSNRFEEFRNIDIIDSGIWNISDPTKHMGNEWFKLLKDFLKGEKLKNVKNYTLKTPFLGRDGKEITTVMPTFGELDSLTKFQTADIDEMQNKNQLGESGGNTIFMRAGLGKARLIMELPILCNGAAHYTVATAHVGLENTMGVPQHQQPTKKLQHMKQGEKIKGAPDDFFFLTNSLWQAVTSSLLINKDTRAPLYPRTRGDDGEASTDLNLVTIKLLRNKSGPSGYSVPLVISQTEGVLASLSEFHYIKEDEQYKRFGIDGNNVTYHLTLYPKVNLMRTTVRELLDNDPLLRRAVKITADILQIKKLYKEIPLEIPPMDLLYDKLEKEYGWDVLLNTRDYWTFDQYTNKVPFLSTMDILETYHGLYKPYFLTSTKAK